MENAQKKRPGPKARQDNREASRLEDVGSEDPFPDIASGTHVQLYQATEIAGNLIDHLISKETLTTMGE